MFRFLEVRHVVNCLLNRMLQINCDSDWRTKKKEINEKIRFIYELTKSFV